MCDTGRKEGSLCDHALQEIMSGNAACVIRKGLYTVSIRPKVC